MHASYTRRELIASGSAGAIVAVAGCSESESDPTDSKSLEGNDEPSQQSVFQEIDIGTDLSITVEQSNVEKVRIAGPDGSMMAQGSPGEMDNTVTIDLLSGYTPGQHAIEAVDPQEEVIDTETVTIEPEINFTGFGFDKEYEKLRQQDTSWDSRPVFHVENTGNGPEKIFQIHASGEYVSGRYAPSFVVEFDEPFEEYIITQDDEGVTIAPGETKRIRVEKELVKFDTPCEKGLMFDFTADMLASDDEEFSGVVSSAEPISGSNRDPSLRIRCEVDSEIQ